MKEILLKMKNKFLNMKTFKIIGITFITIFMILYFIAFFMKDRANNEFSRYVCKEFVNGPRNITALIINKFSGKESISYRTKLLTKSERIDLIENVKYTEKEQIISLYNDKIRILEELYNKTLVEREEKIISLEVLKKENENKIKKLEEFIEKAEENRISEENKNNTVDNIVNEKPHLQFLIEKVTKKIENQNLIDQMLFEELKNEEYLINDPYIVLDPYGESPLTALVIFYTPIPSYIEIQIEGKNKLSEINHSFEKKGYNQRHIVPIYGLYPEINNKIKLVAVSKFGEKIEKELIIETEKLSTKFQNIIIHTILRQEGKYEKGFTFSHSSLSQMGTKFGFDVNGDIRWYLSDNFVQVNYNNFGSIFLTEGNNVHEDTLIYEINPLGRILNVYYTPNGIHHDIEITKNNTMVLTGSRGETIEDFISEVDLHTGKVLYELDYKNILQRTRHIMYGYNNRDWLHINAVVKSKDDIIISGNYQSAIVKTDIKGNLKWILSNPEGFLEKWKPYILKPIGKNFKFSYNQHAVDILEDYDDDPDTLDIILFDNGISRKYLENIDKDYSRIVHYKINEKKMTVEEIWSYGEERPELYSKWRSDADRLKNGNFYGTFNRLSEENLLEDTVYVEVDIEKNVVWEGYGTSKLIANNYSDYRSERLEIYSANTIDIDLEYITKNLIPKEVYEKYGLTKEE